MRTALLRNDGESYPRAAQIEVAIAISRERGDRKKGSRKGQVTKKARKETDGGMGKEQGGLKSERDNRCKNERGK